MNQNQPTNNFLDPKTLIALLMLGVAWMGWQSYMQSKYPDYYEGSAKKHEQRTEKAGTTSIGEGDIENQGRNEDLESGDSVAKNDEVAQPVIKKEQTLTYSDEKISFVMTSFGMGFNEITLQKYTDRDDKKFKFVKTGDIAPLQTGVIGKKSPLYFDIKKVGESRFVGTATYDNMKIVKTVEVVSDKYVFETKIAVIGESDRFLGLKTYLVDKIRNLETSTFTPTFERQEFFIVDDGNEERLLLTKDENVKESFSRTSVASLGTQYFSQSLVDESKIIPEFRIESNEDIAQGALLYTVLDRKNDFTVSYKAFVGPKYLHILEDIDTQLAGLIDFGIFSWLAKPMLQLMKWFHAMVGNWGLAIIVLTLLVRVIVLPFTVMSYKSLNKMKVIQPQIKALKEKHKDDSQKLNQEMMLLMKNSKVNPLGGCLPMLLQFPVFIALYQVLGQSIELYQAPFYFWIDDLSLKDPYYVLPVLMAITMFIQQKITPNTMDPAQAKMMMFLPLVFALFMMSLPSGLTLYIFVSALFAILQQLFFMRDNTNTTAVATA